jgi:hypothetical protein
MSTIAWMAMEDVILPAAEDVRVVNQLPEYVVIRIRKWKTQKAGNMHTLRVYSNPMNRKFCPVLHFLLWKMRVATLTGITDVAFRLIKPSCRSRITCAVSCATLNASCVLMSGHNGAMTNLMPLLLLLPTSARVCRFEHWTTVPERHQAGHHG